ncbi:MAG: PQQ-binding-like beta-propeller repeat protein [Hyphomicrobiaceae bacterium]|nr:PQQ-binding-like beta-propeller repeat protein [Hyphomicrobiaceae bacterium]
MGEVERRSQRLGQLMAPALLVAIGVGGCSDSLPSLPKIGDLNPFAEKQQPLPGTRIPVMQARDKIGGAELASADKPVVLPPPRANEGWTQPGGEPSNSPGHLALAGAVKQAWSADAGTGSSSSGRLTASPIVYGGRVYTLDAAARVTAFSATGGSAVWRASLVPENERGAGGYGGGLAVDSGRLYAATGFGTVVALDPESGKKLWEKNLGVPVRASPTAVGDKVFVVTTEGHVFALAGLDGSELWAFRGLPERTSIISNPSPAVEGGVVAVPYPSGDLVALRADDGTPLWTESLARTRTVSSLASLSDTARPAIDNGVVYAVGHAGRLIATQAKTGERLWSLSVPGTQAPAVAGDILFVVDTTGQLHAITRRDGKVVWTAKLPGSSTWSGPTLAGGLLWLTSNKGQLVGVDPATGRVATQQSLGAPVYIAPVVAGGRMYVLTDKARLVAFN